MIKRVVLAGIALISIQCSEVQTVANQIPSTGINTGFGGLSNQVISSGLKQALDLGIQQGVAQLGKSGGFLNNSLLKIGLPPELQQVVSAMKQVGLGSLADKGVGLLNSAAENAVSTAAPIFTNAVQQMSINDASKILMGGKDAATQYLQEKTTSQLVAAFSPKVSESLNKVGADQLWNTVITKYNGMSGSNINPDLTNYVTTQAINSVFKMVALKEEDIRSNAASRTTDVLKKVFALQDK